MRRVIPRDPLRGQSLTELDKKAPELTPLGPVVITIPEEGVYNEPGYQATDNKDGNLTAEVLVEGDVNSSLPEPMNYFIPYGTQRATYQIYLKEQLSKRIL